MAKAQNLDFEPAQTETSPEGIELAFQREDTRSFIAQIFIFGFFILIALLLIATTFFHLPADVAKDYLLALGSPLGFVIAFYFKSASQN